MHCNRKEAVFQQSKSQDSVGGVSLMESSDLQLKYGKPEGTFEKAVNSDETFCSSLSETAENKKSVIILRHDAIRFTLYLTSLRGIKKNLKSFLIYVFF